MRGLEGRYFAANLKLLDSEAELKSAAVVRFQHGRQNIISTAAPVTKVALRILATLWPQSIQFEDLVKKAKSRFLRMRNAHFDFLDHIKELA